jgi:hypothetical protein
MHASHFDLDYKIKYASSSKQQEDIKMNEMTLIWTMT